jgi:phosphatidylglycerophosphate synthase
MLSRGIAIYRETKKKNDFLFNSHLMRPIAAQLVAVLAPTGVTPNQLTILNLVIFLVAMVLLVVLPSYAGGLIAIGVLELSYCFDCVDGMLARHKRLASKEGHLFDFFTDELKAVLLAAVIAVRLYLTGGIGADGAMWSAASPRFLLAGIGASVVVASAISLTNFVRHPVLSGKEATVEAHYETVEKKKHKSAVAQLASLAMAFLRFLNHYPSHIWIWAIAGRLDVFFWMYLALNALYLARGWLGILVRFGKS